MKHFLIVLMLLASSCSLSLVDGTSLDGFVENTYEDPGPVVESIHVEGSDWELHYSVSGYRIDGVHVIGTLSGGGEVDVTGDVTFVSSDNDSVTISYGDCYTTLAIEHGGELEIHVDPETIFYDFFMPDEFPGSGEAFVGWKDADGGDDASVLQFPIINESRTEDLVITPYYLPLADVFEMDGSVISSTKGTPYEFYGIPSSVTEIGSGAFRSNSTVKAIAFERGAQVKSIDSDSFYFSSLEYIEIPSSVETIAERAFDGATALKSVIFEEGSSLRVIGNDAFSALTMTEFTVPSSVREIGRSAFGLDVYLERVIFEEGTEIESIDPYAFDNDFSLRTIEFISPSSTRIPDGAESAWGAPFSPRVIWDGKVV